MAGLKKYDPRIDSMVMETRTLWGPEVGDVSDDDKAWLAKQVHANPAEAAEVQYERSHTGFTRIITVAVDDVERLYQERVGS